MAHTQADELIRLRALVKTLTELSALPSQAFDPLIAQGYDTAMFRVASEIRLSNQETTHG